MEIIRVIILKNTITIEALKWVWEGKKHTTSDYVLKTDQKTRISLFEARIAFVRICVTERNITLATLDQLNHLGK
jgi:hypothetical protein